MCGLHGQVTHLIVVTTHEHGHLVDEGPRATGTVAVHSQLHALTVEEYHLSVLTTNIDERLRLRITVSGEDGGRNDLLHELRAQTICRGHTHRACDTQSHADVA